MPSREEIENKFFVAGQMDAQGHAAEKMKIGSGGTVLAMSWRFLSEARSLMDEADSEIAALRAENEKLFKELAYEVDQRRQVENLMQLEVGVANQAEAQLTALQAEKEQLQQELAQTWLDDHREHCWQEWPHDGRPCYWPLPKNLTAEQIAALTAQQEKPR